jgi:hypothetical protein
MDQFGTQMKQREAPYFETLIHADRCRLLSLFAVQPGNQTTAWTQNDDINTGTIGSSHLEVMVKDSVITILSSLHDRQWELK